MPDYSHLVPASTVPDIELAEIAEAMQLSETKMPELSGDWAKFKEALSTQAERHQPSKVLPKSDLSTNILKSYHDKHLQACEAKFPQIIEDDPRLGETLCSLALENPPRRPVKRVE